MSQNKPRTIIEEVKQDEAVDAILGRLEKEHGSKIKRVARHMSKGNGKVFHLTLILESYELLEVTIKPAMMFGTTGIEIDVQAF